MKKENRDIVITDIKPGFVDTDMAKGDGLFWIISAETAAEKIYEAIKNKKAKAVIPGKWKIIAMILKIIPDWLYCRL